MNKKLITEIARAKKLMGISTQKQLLQEINFNFLGRLIGKTELDLLIPSLEKVAGRELAGATNIEKLATFLAEKAENGKIIVDWLVKNNLVTGRKIASEILANDAQLEDYLIRAFSNGKTFDQIKDFFKSELQFLPVVAKADGTKVDVANDVLKLAETKAKTANTALPKPSNVEYGPTAEPPLPKPADTGLKQPSQKISSDAATEKLLQRYRLEDPNFVLYENMINGLPVEDMPIALRPTFIAGYTKYGNWTISQLYDEVTSIAQAKNNAEQIVKSPFYNKLKQEAIDHPEKVVKKFGKTGAYFIISIVSLTLLGAIGYKILDAANKIGLVGRSKTTLGGAQIGSTVSANNPPNKKY